MTGDRTPGLKRKKTSQPWERDPSKTPSTRKSKKKKEERNEIIFHKYCGRREYGILTMIGNLTEQREKLMETRNSSLDTRSPKHAINIKKTQRNGLNYFF